MPAGGGGRGGGVKNPYVAVWIENPAGASLRTMVLSHERKGGSDKWLNELRRWFRADQARAAKGGKDVIATMSSPTKVPGSWKAVWDGKNDVGVGVPAGQYVVLIEASREHGGYQLVRHEFTFGGAAFEQILEGNGDVQNVNVALRSN